MKISEDPYDQSVNKVFCDFPFTGSVPKVECEIPTVTLGQELGKRPLNHIKAKAGYKARPTGLCQRGYLIYSSNCLKKTCTWHLHSSRLIQTMLEDWITINYSHEYGAIQTNRIHILKSHIPQVHHVSQL